MYPLGFRVKVFEVKEKEGLTYKETAHRFGIGMTTLMSWNKRLEPKMIRNRPAIKIDSEALKEDVKKNPDDYQYERAKRFGVSTRGIGKALARLKISVKKNSVSLTCGRRKESNLSRAAHGI